MTTQERRRPAVPAHPLAAVPAATCARQRPDVNLFRGRGSNVVHVLEHAGPLCRLRVRRLDRWEGSPPLRLCSLCAVALAQTTLAGSYWHPTRVELGDMHLHAAHQLVADVRERLADIRSAAIYDGSAMSPVELLPTYRREHGIRQDAPPPTLRESVILGQILDRVAPPVVVPSSSADGARQARIDAEVAERQRLTDRVVGGNARRREDRRAAYLAKQARR